MKFLTVLPRILNKNSKLTYLDLSNNNLNEDDFNILCNALKKIQK